MDRTNDDDLAAFDFSVAGAGEPRDGADAFDFSPPEEDPTTDTYDDYAPAEPEPAGAELADLAEDASDGEPEPDPLDAYTSTVTNPPETVSVSALIDGSIRYVKLSPKVTEVSEEQLADEILVLAHLAQQKGLAGQRTYLEDSDLLADGMNDLGLDAGEVIRDLVDNGMGLPTEQEAAAEQAEVFATRYATDGN